MTYECDIVGSSWFDDRSAFSLLQPCQSITKDNNKDNNVNNLLSIILVCVKENEFNNLRS